MESPPYVFLTWAGSPSSFDFAYRYHSSPHLAMVFVLFPSFFFTPLIHLARAKNQLVLNYLRQQKKRRASSSI